MVYKLEISKYCSSNVRVRIKQSIKSQKGYAYRKTEKPGRNQVETSLESLGSCESISLQTRQTGKNMKKITL